MIVLLARITEAQAAEINGQLFAPDSYLAPTRINGEWWLSEIEVNECVNPELEWVRKLELIEVELPHVVENSRDHET